MHQYTTLQWRAFPALLYAACFSAGIFVSLHLFSIHFWIWIFLSLTGIIFIIIVHINSRHRLFSLHRLYRTLFVFSVFFFLGAARFQISRTYPQRHIIQLIERVAGTVTLEGLVESSPLEYERSTRFTLTLTGLLFQEEWSGVTGKIQVVVYKDGPSSIDYEQLILPGDLVRMTCDLRGLQEKRNPSSFDYGKYLRSKKIFAVAYLNDRSQIHTRSHSKKWTLRIINRTRLFIRKNIGYLVESRQSRSVLLALLLGDRSRIDVETRDRFSAVGIMHLLAVSGLHVLLVGMVFYEFLRSVLIRFRFSWFYIEIFRAAFTTIVLLFYMFLVGSGSSVTRAVLMTILFMLAHVLQRSSSTLNTLGFAAFVLLLTDPLQLIDVGFQLSFSAVASIISLYPIANKYFLIPSKNKYLRKYILSPICISICATVGTMPVLLHHFGFVSFAGLVLNIPAIPLTFLTLASGILMLLASLLSASFPAALLGHSANFFSSLLLKTAEAGEIVFSWFKIETYLNSPLFIVSFAFFIITLTKLEYPKSRWRFFILACSLIIAGLFSNIYQKVYFPSLEVLFFDVGQGDATILSFPNGKNVLIDAGSRDTYSDQAVRTILPHFERYGIHHIDAVVITHQHSDHLGGVPTILRSLPVRRLIYNGKKHRSSIFSEVLMLCDSLHIEPQIVSAGDTLNIDYTTRIHILAPHASSLHSISMNDASLVLRLSYGNNVFLFTGDAEESSEEMMISNYGNLLPSDIVKVAHHGSSTSSTSPFVKRVFSDNTSVSFAVVSVALKNQFGHPDTDVLVEWKKTDATVLLTSTDHALWFSSNGYDLRRRKWR